MKYERKLSAHNDGTLATDLGDPKDHSVGPTDPQVATT